MQLDLLHIHVFVLLSKYTCKQIINCFGELSAVFNVIPWNKTDVGGVFLFLAALWSHTETGLTSSLSSCFLVLLSLSHMVL